MIKLYKNWKDYYESKQEYYLDDENVADCDVQMKIGNYKLYGKSDIGAYELCGDCETYGILTIDASGNAAKDLLAALDGFKDFLAPCKNALERVLDDIFNEHNDEMIKNYLACDYLTLNTCRSGRVVAWYFDGKNESARYVNTGERLNKEQIENELA